MYQKCLLLQLEKEPQVTRSDESHSQCHVTSHESNLKFSRGAGNDKKEVKVKEAFCGAPGHKCLNTTSIQEEKRWVFSSLCPTIVTTQNMFDTHLPNCILEKKKKKKR